MAFIKFKNSSSFKLATFFTLLLASSVGIVIYLIMLANHHLHMLAGQNIAEIENTQNIIRWLGFAIICALAIVVLVGYFVGKYVVNLINTISDTADNIMKSGDLSRRIPVTHQRDDLSKLAHVLNSMFDRIETLLAGVRQVSDNIAHDLRTPLSRLRNRLEGFDGSADEKEKLINEADNLIAIFNALLRIARIEQSKDIRRFAKVDMQQLLNDVIEFYEPLAQTKRQKFKTSIGKCKISGDKDLLFQMVANLLDNAIKFTPKNGEISISAKSRSGKLSIKIADSGAGIAESDRDKVFTRFYRAESSRTTSGHGLGLSLVAAIANLHSAKITLSNKNGLLVCIDF